MSAFAKAAFNGSIVKGFPFPDKISMPFLIQSFRKLSSKTAPIITAAASLYPS